MFKKLNISVDIIFKKWYIICKKQNNQERRCTDGDFNKSWL